MKKMGYFVLATFAVLTLGALIMGCKSRYRTTNTANDLNKSSDVPAAIADANLLSYKYSRNGTMRWPLHSENVERCKDDSTRCVIRLFDQSRMDPDNVDQNGDPLPDTLIVSSEVLDTVKQMIIDARAWRFKDDYSPRTQTMDGESWGYSASFAPTDSMLAATPEAKRPRLLRNGGCKLSSGGSNASPDTDLFERVRIYLQGIYDSETSGR